MNCEKKKICCNDDIVSGASDNEIGYICYLQIIELINELYEKSAEENFWGEYGKEFDRLLDSLPDDVWVQ